MDRNLNRVPTTLKPPACFGAFLRSASLCAIAFFFVTGVASVASGAQISTAQSLFYYPAWATEQCAQGGNIFEGLVLDWRASMALVIVWSITITRPPSRPPDRVAANGLWRAEPVEASGQRGG